jgi:hypothetical protein
MNDKTMFALAALGTKGLDSEAIKNLLGPATKNLGLIGGDLTDIVRFYMRDNLGKVFTEWARQRNNKPLEPADIPKVIPLLQAASLQADEELRDHWAALLESTVSTPDGVLPSFGQTLAQLTAQEAKYLQSLHLHYEERARQRQGKIALSLRTQIKNALGRLDVLVRIYCGNKNETQLQKNQARLVVQDLERLGLITRSQVAKKDIFGQPFDGGDLKLETIYAFSEYGLRFIEAVRPKTS